ncbi:thymus-specific serine protease-like [Saccoglossus kowalevskii]|uniref:Thymus-specific serine protease-like n=1 Tax=Saccoglossus kowalevskii TaxID=10224 RepID=A0ABM0GV68_SACKO|nr:PREDICTED: thymus-specific serine protease-like [Saccoglossus kowalevskii]
MKTLLLVLSFTCVFEISNSILGTHFWKFQEKVGQYKKKRFLKNKLRWQKVFSPNSHLMYSEFEDLYLEQPLDHFDPLVTDIYEQRYWVNPTYWNKENGPVFLFIGGEGALGAYDVEEGEHVDLAKKYGALIFAVEHRFYGASINKDGLKLEYLQYLSSQQALADLASFHRFATSKYNITQSNIWICFGGSYPGSLSAWFRLKYPHLVYGAIASSAPVRVVKNFEGYNQVVAASLADPVVKGSLKCSDNIAAAFKIIDQKIKDKQFDTLKADFKSCNNISSYNDTALFLNNLAGIFMGIVQYNNEMPDWNVAAVCQNMTQPASPYDNLVKFTTIYLDGMGQECFDNSYDNFIQELEDTTPTEEGVGVRQWTYQTCSQFGYYQTCDQNTTCLFSPLIDLKSSLEVCTTVFGIHGKIVDKQVDFTNSYYGANHPKGTRIVFVNGSIDPWHALSVLRNESPSQISIYINGTAHCANMKSQQPTDPPSLVEARQKIDAQIGEWLNETKLPNKDMRLYFTV